MAYFEKKRNVKNRVKIEPKDLTVMLSDLKGSSLSVQKKAVRMLGKSD